MPARLGAQAEPRCIAKRCKCKCSRFAHVFRAFATREFKDHARRLIHTGRNSEEIIAFVQARSRSRSLSVVRTAAYF